MAMDLATVMAMAMAAIRRRRRRADGIECASRCRRNDAGHTAVDSSWN